MTYYKPFQSRVLKPTHPVWHATILHRSVQSSVKRFVGSLDANHAITQDERVRNGIVNATTAGAARTPEEVGQAPTMSNGAIPWSDGDVARLAELRRSGKSVRQIQQEDFPERSFYALGGKLRSLMPSTTKWTESEVDTLRAMRELGMSYAKIQQNKLPHRTVGAIRDKLRQLKHPDSPPRRRPWSDADLEKLITLRRQHYTTHAMTEFFPGQTRFDIENQFRMLAGRSLLPTSINFSN